MTDGNNNSAGMGSCEAPTKEVGNSSNLQAVTEVVNAYVGTDGSVSFDAGELVNMF